jgi:gliding motility-associated lipoprotein GldH
MRFTSRFFAPLIFAVVLCLAMACGTLDVYEKNFSFPKTEWDYTQKPQFELNISDTTFYYNIYITLRHTDAYRFSNIWLMVHTQLPEQAAHTKRVELPLAEPSGKWLARGMDGIYEHRIQIQNHAIFNKTGLVKFTLEQNMRINPLQNMLSVGVRVQKTEKR